MPYERSGGVAKISHLSTSQRKKRRVADYSIVNVSKKVEGKRRFGGPSKKTMKEIISLPRNPLPHGIVGKDYSLPDDYDQQRVLIPDHVTEARREAVYQFLETVLLPRVRDERPLEVGELVEQAIKFKTEFRREHPKDFVGEFELITAAELRLVQLQIHFKARKAEYGERSEEAELVAKLLAELRPLLDSYPEDLYSI